MAGVLLLALVASACSGPTSAAGRAFRPSTPDTLTVATAALPAPGFWVPDGAGGYQGFEAALADELADRLGLDRVRVVEVPFTRLVAGDLGRADLALAQLTPTAARDDLLDFTTPYLEAPPAVLGRTGEEARDAAELQDLRWVVSEGTTLAEVVADRIRPDEEPLVVPRRGDALAALRDGRADAYLLDLPVAQALAEAEADQLEVLGQLAGDEGLAAALPDGSADRDAVDAAIRALGADGTLDRLARRWLDGDGDDVPLIRVDR